MKKLIIKSKITILLGVILVLLIIIGIISILFKENVLNLSEKNNISDNVKIEEYNGQIYYIYENDYQGDYDIQTLSFPDKEVPNGFNVCELMNYNEYEYYCNKYNIKKKYEDEESRYLMFSYAKVGAAYIEVELGDVVYNGGVATMYIWDDENGIVADTAAYVIIVPTNNNIKKLEIQPLYTKMEFNKKAEKYPISGMIYTVEENKKIAQASHINSDNIELNEIVNKMYDAILANHTLEIETKYSDNEISYKYIDFINSTKKGISDNQVYFYETLTDMETISYNNWGFGNSFQKIYSNSTREDILVDQFKSEDCYLLTNNDIDFNIEIINEQNEVKIVAKRKGLEYGESYNVEEVYYIDKETNLLNKFVINDEKYGLKESKCLYTDTNIIIPEEVLNIKEEPFSSEDKPIIYLYPEEDTNINVKLENYQNITCSYPKYDKNGWNVLAKSTGELIDLNTGRSLYALYWEGKNYETLDMSEGFVVSGKDSAKFLEEKLEILGLNEREAEEFIIYWLPQLEKNKYNFIRFQSIEEINKNMPLKITPTPDSIIRVMMEWKPLEEYINLPEQKLETPIRNGFTVVEWGGTKLN